MLCRRPQREPALEQLLRLQEIGADPDAVRAEPRLPAPVGARADPLLNREL